MNRSKRVQIVLLMLLNTLGCGPAAAQLTQQDVARLAVAPADHRIAYGADPLQFGDLRLPKGNGPHPVAIVIHGGCWLAAFADLQLMAPLSDALTLAGIATWNIEFRSVDSQVAVGLTRCSMLRARLTTRESLRLSIRSI